MKHVGLDFRIYHNPQRFWSAVAERSGDTALAWTRQAVLRISGVVQSGSQSGVAASLCHRTPKRLVVVLLRYTTRLP